ncbi:hypothetical protein [Cupriavidus basilensis]|uniref:hypothetical protein n=1 Tax=Cupriavidus basilensis TaxID=68895 RepID=UPI0039F74252
MNKVLNPWYREEWKNVGFGMSMFVPKSPLPAIFGTTTSSFGQEAMGNATNIIMTKPITGGSR